MLIRLINSSLTLALIGTLVSLFLLSGGYFLLKPSLPEINLVDEDALQIPLKVYSADGVLIGEFGDQKRRTIEFGDIPNNLKNAFLAAEDDQFFQHQGIRVPSLVRAFYQMIRSGEIVSGGGTISMQVVRGYLLSREQKIVRKIKEIYLAFELESVASKEEILSLYLNTIFLGNRSYGVEAAANQYFAKSINELTLAESALIASSAQLPSRINPIRSPDRALIRRNWILGRMFKLGYIGKAQYLLAKDEPIVLSQLQTRFSLDGRYIAEIARQALIDRYGLSVYKDGLSVYTTIDSKLQQAALESINENLYLYDKRHGWREPVNLLNKIPEIVFTELRNQNTDILYETSNFQDELGMNQLFISIIRDYFENSKNLDKHIGGIVIDVKPERIIYLSNSFKLESLSWNDQYKWARRKININKLGPVPSNFYDILRSGDFIYLTNIDGEVYLDQIPEAEAAFISVDPTNGAIKSYIGGLNFSKSNFDRVRQSFPQAGSSFKPFIYASAFANGYNASDKINDAPIIFEDSNLESSWRPENYTGRFYGPIRLREALVQSVNLVSIKLLREIGISNTQDFLTKFGFEKSRLAPDLSLALGSSSFSPAEMVRAYTILANSMNPQDPFFIDKIVNRDDDVIYQHSFFSKETHSQDSLDAFPWFQTQIADEIKPFTLLPPLSKISDPIDPRIVFITKDILREALSRGANARQVGVLKRNDIAGKTGTTNNSISTWFSGFHNNLVTTVWVGTDDFSSLGENEFGSSIALPTWVDFMKTALADLPNEPWKSPKGLSYIRVDRDTGKPTDQASKNAYFELLLEEKN
jgi:penicillin-binding protein 1A